MYTFDTVTTAYSMNPYKLLHTNVTDLPKKGSKSYKSITYENYRIRKQDISNTMLSKCLSWFNKKAPLSTLHEQSRCRQYLNSKTRDKYYEDINVSNTIPHSGKIFKKIEHEPIVVIVYDLSPSQAQEETIITTTVTFQNKNKTYNLYHIKTKKDKFIV